MGYTERINRLCHLKEKELVDEQNIHGDFVSPRKVIRVWVPDRPDIKDKMNKAIVSYVVSRSVMVGPTDLMSMQDVRQNRRIVRDAVDVPHPAFPTKRGSIAIQIGVSSQMKVCKKLLSHAREHELTVVDFPDCRSVPIPDRYLVASYSTTTADICLDKPLPQLRLSATAVEVEHKNRGQLPFSGSITVPENVFVETKNEVMDGTDGTVICSDGDSTARYDTQDEARLYFVGVSSFPNSVTVIRNEGTVNRLLC